MEFIDWLRESEEDERVKLFNFYVKSFSDLYNKYGFSLANDWINHLRKLFMTSSMDDVMNKISDLPNLLKSNEFSLAREKREKDKQIQQRNNALETRNDIYYRAESSFERVVCSKGNPGFDKSGMIAYPMTGIDNDLIGYYGVHVGGGWLPILKRDGYCDDGDAYLYEIHAEDMNNDGINVYAMDDPHVAYRDINTPESKIIFCKMKLFPYQYIELKKVIPEKDIKEADPAQGMDDGGWMI
jgi:hypothetical protein